MYISSYNTRLTMHDEKDPRRLGLTILRTYCSSFCNWCFNSSTLANRRSPAQTDASKPPTLAHIDRQQNQTDVLLEWDRTEESWVALPNWPSHSPNPPLYCINAERRKQQTSKISEISRRKTNNSAPLIAWLHNTSEAI